MNPTEIKQAMGRDLGLANENARALVLVNAPLQKAYIVEHGKPTLPGRFLFEFRQGECVIPAQVYGSKSNDPVFLDAVENALLSLGYAFTYPSEADHVWLCADQFAPTLPNDWRVFWDETSGSDLQRERFYGFSDAGGLVGGDEGYETRESAIQACKAEGETEIGIEPENLGDCAVSVLSADEYVKRLHVLVPEGAYFYGTFKV